MIHKKSGTISDFRKWMLTLTEQRNANLIPFTWVPEFVGVSRASVHKAIHRGRLTCFQFQIREPYHQIMSTESKQPPSYKFAYCLKSECLNWQERLMKRKARKDKRRH